MSDVAELLAAAARALNDYARTEREVLVGPLGRECHAEGCDRPRLTYGHLCGPCDPFWAPPAPVRCQRPLRCYCPADGCLGHPDAPWRPQRPTPMPTPLVELRDQLAQRRRNQTIERARS